MKRFYCTICKRVKRVRVYPANVEQVSSELPTSRVGVCTRHNTPVKPRFIRTTEYAKVGR